MPIDPHKLKKRLKENREEALSRWNRVYKDAQHGSINTDSIAFAMDQLNRIDQEILNQRFGDLFHAC